MQRLSSEGAQFRTKCLPLARAASFARCLQANPNFGAVTIEESARAKGEARWFVAYVPTNPERIASVLADQQDKRQAKASTEGACYEFVADESGRFFWCLSTSGEVYEVTRHSCSCPDFEHRCRHAGLACKHMLAHRTAALVGEFEKVPAATYAEVAE